MANRFFAYEAIGDINAIVDSLMSQTQTFTYDALDRLKTAIATGDSSQGGYATETYTYNSATGNLASKAGVNYTYNSGHAHAVSSLSNGNSYSYDANGNMTSRYVNGDSFTLNYDAENRLVSVTGAATANFYYDGDGTRVKSVMGSDTILFVGNYFEQKGSQTTKYYFAGSTRIALRKYTIPQNMTLEYMMGDHLGSTSITTDASGVKISELRYKAWGETRYTWTNAPANTTPTYELTKYQFTGQYSYTAEFGLHFYGARFYDSAVGRFVSPDSIIPPGTQGYDRFAYTYNNPLRYNDPTGHCPMCIGAVLGAAFGAATYLITSAASGRSFNGGDFAASVAVGAVGGFLIGTGVGIGAGVAALAAAGAGAGVLSAQVGYSAAAGQDFDSGELAIAATVGGVAGAAKGALTATGAGGTTAGTFIDGVAGAVQYGATEMYHGRSMDLGLAVESTAAGVVSAGVSGIVDEGFRAFSSPNNNIMWINTAANSQNWLSSSTTTYLARGALIEEAVSETLVSSTSELVNNFVDDYIDR